MPAEQFATYAYLLAATFAYLLPDEQVEQARQLATRQDGSIQTRRAQVWTAPADRGDPRHRQLKAKLIEYAAHLMERPAAELMCRDGAVRAKVGTGPSYSVKDLAGCVRARAP